MNREELIREFGEEFAEWYMKYNEVFESAYSGTIREMHDAFEAGAQAERRADGLIPD